MENLAWWVYVAFFAVGVVLVSAVFYFTFNPRMLATESGEIDLVVVARTLLIIIMTAITLTSMLLLGRHYIFTPQTF